MFKALIYILTAIIYLSLLTDYSPAQERETLTLTVREAVRIAKENNSTLGLTRAEIDVARSKIRKAKSRYYPHITSKIVVPLVGRESGVSLDQLIYDFGKTSNIVKASRLEKDVSEFSHKENIDDVITETKISYYRAVIADNNAESIRKKVEKNNLQLMKIKELVNSGRSSHIELTEANSDLAESKLMLTNAENIYEQRMLELFNNMGIEPDERYKLEEETEIDKIKYNLNETKDLAFKNSLELKKLRAELSGIEARLSSRKSEFLPEIFGRTAYRLEGEGADDEGTETPAFIAGVGVKFPIFLGFSRFAEIDESNAQHTRALSRIKHARELLSTEVEQIWMDINYAIKRIEVTRNNLDLAEDNLELVREKSEMGRASRLDVADAESFYSESLAKYKEALYLYKISKARYDRIIGDTERNES